MIIFMNGKRKNKKLMFFSLAVIAAVGIGLYLYSMRSSLQLSSPCPASSNKDFTRPEGSISEIGGIGNIWPRDYIDENGITQRGPVAQLSIPGNKTSDDYDIYVHRGSILTVTSSRLSGYGKHYCILDVVENPSGSGYIKVVEI